MAKRTATAAPASHDEPVRANGSPPGGKPKPVHEVRVGKVKAVIWANQTESGVRHNVTFRRLFKRDTNAQWEQSDSFGREDLPLVMEVARQAWLWIYGHASQGG